MKHVPRRGVIYAGEAAIAVGGMIKRGTVAKLLGPVVLRSTDDHRIGRGMLIDELELCDHKSFIEGVVPCRAAIRGFIDAAVISSINHQVIRRLTGEGVIVG